MSVSLLFSRGSESTCTLCGNPRNCQTAQLLGQGPEMCLTTLKIAVSVLVSPTPEIIRYLKDFLSVLPTPLCIEQVLLQAICQLAEQNLEVCRQVLVYVEVFQPELDLKQMVQQAVIEFLQAENFTLNRDYHIDQTGRLHLSTEAAVTALAALTDSDRLLVTELL